MTLRFKIVFFLILLSIAGVIGATLLVLQRAVADKRSYVTELNSVLAPQVKNSVDQKIFSLLNNLQALASGISSKTKALQDIKSQFSEVGAILIAAERGRLIVIPINEDEKTKADIQAATEQLKSLDSVSLKARGLSFLGTGLFAFRTENGTLGAILLRKDFLNGPFELARGKEINLVDDRGRVLIEGSAGKDVLTSMPAQLNNAGADVFAQELKDNLGRTRYANFARLSSVKNSYVLITAPQITWLDLALPLVSSSLWLLIVLIASSVGVAFYISASLASPIEQLAEETARIGRGEWAHVKNSTDARELRKLSVAFNRMIDNLQDRELQLKNANAKLIQTESLAAVGRIGAGIAHEVKNPLASILSYCQLLDINLKNFNPTAEDSSSKLEKFKNYSKLIADDTRRASKIISDLLTFARQKDLQTARCRAADFLQESQDKLKAVCDTAGVEISFAGSPDSVDLSMKIDNEQIYRVLFNLVQNACHALQECNVEPKKILVQLARKEQFVCIDVSDNGPGIPEENLAKIFEPFFSTKKIGEGSGLGLAICYGIVLKHGGQIQVASKIGHGTTFSILLPAA